MASVYLDSCIVIYLIQGPEELSQAIFQALRPNAGEPAPCPPARLPPRLAGSP